MFFPDDLPEVYDLLFGFGSVHNQVNVFAPLNQMVNFQTVGTSIKIGDYGVWDADGGLVMCEQYGACV